MFRHGIVAGILLVCSLAGTARAAEIFPSHALTMVVPTAPGGSSDTTARIIAEGLATDLKQSVIVENKTGASGAIGAAYVAKAAPDGYTLFFGTGSTHVVVPLTMKDISYDPVRDFTPIVLVGNAPFVLFVSSQLPVKSMQELIAYAHSRPGQLSFGTTGPSTIYEIAALMLEQETGLKFNHIPYKGLTPMALDVAAGRVDIGVGPIDGYLKSDKLRILALLGSERAEALPNIPSSTEQGISGVSLPGWAAIWAPAGTPAAVVATLTRAVQTVLGRKDVRDRIQATGIYVQAGDNTALAQLMAHDTKAARTALDRAGAHAAN